MRQKAIFGTWLAMVLLSMALAGCGKKSIPVARPTPPPPPAADSSTSDANRPPTPPSPVVEPRVAVPSEPLSEDSINSASLDELNRDSPLRPVFFDLDSSELSADNQRVLDANAVVLKRQSTWTVTIEGHCDERGTAEYNLALGERRAIAARAYLVSLGLPADRLRTVSYGKEFPFDPGHEEASWAKNRRAHFVITAK
jgi:peptidoglycan-associated lipoprotein